MSQDTERLSDEHIANIIEMMPAEWIAVALAREVQASRKALAEIYAIHRPEWASDQARIAGKEPWCCMFCGTADGGWPCDTRILAAEALGVEA